MSFGFGHVCILLLSTTFYICSSSILVKTLAVILFTLIIISNTTSSMIIQEHFAKRCILGQREGAGLGDRLLDSIGYCVIRLRQNKAVVVEWCDGLGEFNRSLGRSSYDRDLFYFPFETQCTGDSDILESHMSGTSYNPFHVAEILGLETVDEALVQDFVDVASKIGPSSALMDYIPLKSDLSDVVGIHLRKSDKVVTGIPKGHSFLTNVEEFNRIMDATRDYIRTTYSDGQRFFVCSEDGEHRDEMISYLQSLGKGYVVISETPTNATPPSKDLVDFFTLSRCKEIVQGISYSTFSMVAAIIGRIPLVNFYENNILLDDWRQLLVNSGPTVSRTSSVHGDVPKKDALDLETCMD